MAGYSSQYPANRPTWASLPGTVGRRMSFSERDSEKGRGVPAYSTYSDQNNSRGLNYDDLEDEEEDEEDEVSYYKEYNHEQNVSRMQSDGRFHPELHQSLTGVSPHVGPVIRYEPQRGSILQAIFTNNQLRLYRADVIEALRDVSWPASKIDQAEAVVVEARDQVKASTLSRSIHTGKSPPKHQFDLCLSTLHRFSRYCIHQNLCPWPIHPLLVALWMQDSFGEQVARKTLYNYVRCLDFAREQTSHLFGTTPTLTTSNPPAIGGSGPSSSGSSHVYNTTTTGSLRHHPVLAELLNSRAPMMSKTKKTRSDSMMGGNEGYAEPGRRWDDSSMRASGQVSTYMRAQSPPLPPLVR